MLMSGELFTDDYMKRSAAFKNGIGEINDKYKDWKRAVGTSLDPKTVELISIAVGSALRCAYCVESHAGKAKAKGASEKEIAHAVSIAAGIAAGSALSYGVLAFKE
jgi:AhpD family alkylhydroperoxidase